jgi:hypothetical protein
MYEQIMGSPGNTCNKLGSPGNTKNKVGSPGNRCNRIGFPGNIHKNRFPLKYLEILEIK